MFLRHCIPVTLRLTSVRTIGVGAGVGEYCGTGKGVGVDAIGLIEFEV
jgi:hypothetical protein